MTMTALQAHHVGVTVADLEQVLPFYRDELEAFYAGLSADVETLSEPRTTASGTTILFCRDPEGNLVEVLEV